jgi:hypothetical protein
LRVLSGKLRCRSVRITAAGTRTKMRVGEKEYPHSATASGTTRLFSAEQMIMLATGDELQIEVAG